MRGTANTSSEGRFCGRAVHGVSNLGSEQMREIEAHRSKDRPTPWPHLAARYGVNEIDLRRLFDPANDDAPARPTAVAPLSKEEQAARRDERFRAMWIADVPAEQIMAALTMSHQTVHNFRARLGLQKRPQGRRPGRDVRPSAVADRVAWNRIGDWGRGA